ncbi:hypothetical protein F2Q69_00055157 [Brassica cretica]|uniref:Uncharacterized protein n=1 Tax=Brassica cretica TaxID=69181 RepID=A0A8S9N1K7_BRACR|nr:hypothetical protein F2Q69_00055157 [Brassica cretica]
MSFTMVNGSSQIRSVLFVSCKDRCNEGVRNHENQCDTETTDQLKYRQCSQVSTRLSGNGKPKPLALAPSWLKGVN